MTKFITINERAAVMAIELCFGKAGVEAIRAVYDVISVAEATGRDEGYNEGFDACLRIVQPETVETMPIYTVTPDGVINPAEAAAAEAVLYGK